MSVQRILLVFVLFAAVASCRHAPKIEAENGHESVAYDLPAMALELLAEGLEHPVHLAAPVGDPRLFVVERKGRVRVIEDGKLLETPFLDIAGRVESGFNEQGLLSIAFHPEFAENRRFFVDYTAKVTGETIIAEFAANEDGRSADPGSEKKLLTQAQFAVNHNGGQLAFGPDKMLYVGFGDGGGAGDPERNGQNLGTLLGKILRLDVDGESLIPADNPFVGVDKARGEIWSYGWRNPWRFSFDRETGALYAGDVGQHKWEEVSYSEHAAARGANFGWSVMEGDACFRDKGCDPSPFVAPVVSYSHVAGFCSVTGGHVYRGEAIPGLQGWYLYADFCIGSVQALHIVDGKKVADVEISDKLAPQGRADLQFVSSFGEDSNGELYILLLDGEVMKVVPAP